MKSIQMTLGFEGMSSAVLAAALVDVLPIASLPPSALDLQVRAAPRVTRSIDPTVLVAATSTVGAVVGALITGLLQLAQDRRSGSIIVVTRDGSRLEAPASVTAEQLDLLVTRARALDVAHIHVNAEQPSGAPVVE